MLLRHYLASRRPAQGDRIVVDRNQQTQDNKRVARLERLIEMSRSLNSTLNMRPLLQRIVRAAQELTETAECSIMLLERKSGQLYFTAATNMPGVRSIVVPMEGSVAGWVVQTGESLVVPDARQDPRFYRKADEQSTLTTHSILAVPLTTRDRKSVV